MKSNRLLTWAPALLVATSTLVLPAVPAHAQASAPNAGATPQARVIVQYKSQSALTRAVPLQAAGDRQDVSSRVQRRADQLARTARVPLSAGRAISENAHVVTATGLTSAELAKRLAADPSVASAEVDGRKRVFAPPNDPLYTAGPTINLTGRQGGPVSGQWYAKAPTAEVRSGVNAEAVWGRSINGSGVVVAVLDTGVFRNHLDLSNRLLAGYDFITRTEVANDGSARDADATDPGDFLSDGEVNDVNSEFYGGSPNFCSTLDGITNRYRAVSSSWHGTKVSGIIAGESGNSQGIAGIAHGARVLPVRVLGKCGGFDSDILAGMRWAAGLSVPGVPVNATPAKILNMSLGSEGSCSSSYRDAVAEITATGAVIIAAAGNSSGKAVGTPANCAGVIAVAGLRHAGTKVGFSDLGPEIAIAAPGGNCVNTRAGTPCLYPILTTTNAGSTQPLTGSPYTDAFDIAVGTSFAAPIVSATAALMLAARPGLLPDEIRRLLQSTARAFPTSGADNGPDDSTPVLQCTSPGSAEQLQCYCTTGLCGAGMLDADAATSAAAQALMARISFSPATPVAGTAVALSSATSLVVSGRTITRWQWALVTGGGIVTDLSGAKNAATASALPGGPGSFTVRLTVFDDQNRSASTDSTITVAAVPASTPSPDAGSAGDSGGGSMSAAWLLALGLATVLLAFARKQRATRAQAVRPQ
jgi:serine protease